MHEYARNVTVIVRDGKWWEEAKVNNMLADLPPVMLEDSGDEEKGLCVPQVLDPGIHDSFNQLVHPLRGGKPHCCMLTDSWEVPSGGA